MGRGYIEGWLDACQAFTEELESIAPAHIRTLVAAYQVHDIITIVRAQAVDDPRPPLTAWEERLEHYGLKP